MTTVSWKTSEADSCFLFILKFGVTCCTSKGDHTLFKTALVPKRWAEAGIYLMALVIVMWWRRGSQDLSSCLRGEWEQKSQRKLGTAFLHPISWRREWTSYLESTSYSWWASCRSEPSVCHFLCVTSCFLWGFKLGPMGLISHFL